MSVDETPPVGAASRSLDAEAGGIAPDTGADPDPACASRPSDPTCASPSRDWPMAPCVRAVVPLSRAAMSAPPRGVEASAAATLSPADAPTTGARGSTMTRSEDSTRSPSGPVTASVSTRGASPSGRVRNATKVPSRFAVAVATSAPSRRTETVAPGPALPAIRVKPSASTRTTSNAGIPTGAGPVAWRGGPSAPECGAATAASVCAPVASSSPGPASRDGSVPATCPADTTGATSTASPSSAGTRSSACRTTSGG